MKQSFGCKDETCWIDHTVPEETTRHRGARQSLLSLYRPKIPQTFVEKPSSWWSTSMIQSVMEPYRYAYPFYWCGVVPLDFKEQKAVSICLSREACAVDMKQLLDNGCCIVGVIFNLDYSWESGSHWVAGMVDIKRGDVCFFDSYGYEPLKLIQEWLDNCRNSLNRFALKGTWANTEERILRLSEDDVGWSNNKTVSVQVPVSHRLKIDKGHIFISNKTKRKFVVEVRKDRKVFQLNRSTRKEERESGWQVVGARVHSLSRKVQTSLTECGSYSIHVLLSAIHGKSWHSILKSLPKDKEIKQLRQTLFRS